MDKTYLSDNIHLIRMAVDHFLHHYKPETNIEFELQLEMSRFMYELEKDVSE